MAQEVPWILWDLVTSGISLVVEQLLPKQQAGVRFSYPAPS